MAFVEVGALVFVGGLLLLLLAFFAKWVGLALLVVGVLLLVGLITVAEIVSVV
jgi:hypothetical protein